MNHVRARRRPPFSQRLAPAAKGRKRGGQFERILQHTTKALAYISFFFLVFITWWVLRPAVDTTTFLVAGAILAFVSILWVPKLQIWRLGLKSDIARFNAENEARKTIATLIGGLAIFLSFYTAQKQLGVQQQVQFTDRYTKAIDEIAASDGAGNPNLPVRIGGLYVLEQIMNSSEAQHASILEVLCAYIRQNSLQSVLKPSDGPRNDVRVALTILGRRNRDQEIVAERHRNLAGPTSAMPIFRAALLPLGLIMRDLMARVWKAQLFPGSSQGLRSRTPTWG